jgi:hypothetical protein
MILQPIDIDADRRRAGFYTAVIGLKTGLAVMILLAGSSR